MLYAFSFIDKSLQVSTATMPVDKYEYFLKAGIIEPAKDKEKLKAALQGLF